MAFRRLRLLFSCLSGIYTKSAAVREDCYLPKSSSSISDERGLSNEGKCLVPNAALQGGSAVAAPAAPRVASRAIARTAIIHDEERSRSEDRLSSLVSSPAGSPHLTDIGPRMPALQPYLAQPNCSTAFTLDQQLWTHLAGHNTHYWLNHSDSQEVDDRSLYAPLDEKRKEIRVLKVSRPVHGGTGEFDTFQADLVCVSLDDDPAYLAVSYIWGDPLIVGHLGSHHEGRRRTIPFNKGVFDIINTILARGETLYLWIDALCINQEDLNERASQVAMMGTIFSRARQVVGFNGQTDETSTTAMDFILLTANCIWAHGSLLDCATAPGLASLLSEIGPEARDWESVKGFISRPWFHRLWIVQEIALGNDPVLVCGRHSLTWCALTLFLDFTCMVQRFPAFERIMNSTSDAYMTALEWLPNALGISDARRVPGIGGLTLPFLHSLMALNANFDSTDPRDRIYALLGLTTAEKYRDALRPDYGVKVEDLHVMVARQMFVNDGNVRFLHMAGVGHRHSLSLPSWVPDWTSLPRNTTHHLSLSGHPAWEENTEVCQPRFSFDPGSPLIFTLYGRIIDSISLIIRDPYPDFHSWREQPYYVTAAAYMDAVMRLVHATHPESVGKPPSERPWTKQLMETLSASGSPLGDFWSHLQKVVDDAGTVRTWTATEVGFGKFLERLRRWSCDRYIVPETSDEVFDFTGLFFMAAVGRRFYISSAGHFGLACEGARVGDLVCAFEGHRVPFVVRPVDEADKSKGVYLVGEAYQHNFCAGRLVLNRGEGVPIRLV